MPNTFFQGRGQKPLHGGFSPPGYGPARRYSIFVSVGLGHICGIE